MATWMSMPCRATLRLLKCSLQPPCLSPDAENLCGLTQQEAEPHTTPHMSSVFGKNNLTHYPSHVTNRDRELAAVSMPHACCSSRYQELTSP